MCFNSITSVAFDIPPLICKYTCCYTMPYLLAALYDSLKEKVAGTLAMLNSFMGPGNSNHLFTSALAVSIASSRMAPTASGSSSKSAACRRIFTVVKYTSRLNHLTECNCRLRSFTIIETLHACSST